ncbi:LVIVD repeat-containing protein [Natronococcus occultus]|uniref:LVIVD repeat protein n=1 Tax=Natronococcus occultus SP4 TaxID=694430 RepID=L0K5P1_9EURY|nr:hypothetical protein [Natronococcus occultus]AGB39438.1 hypothetical protein Natoc_3723 [Natronococcus occultus SP4]
MPTRRTLLRRAAVAGAATATIGSGPVAAEPSSEIDGDERRARGRIDPIGHVLPEDAPAYTFGHVSPDGEWGVMGSFPRSDSDVASTLIDLSELENPSVAHELPTANELTRTNDVKFDPLREGIYVRSQEAEDEGELTDPEPDPQGEEGFEVVDFGWEEGTPEDPAVIASVETPNTGVHKITEHPEEPVLYVIDKQFEEPGIIAVDFSDPADPALHSAFGIDGYCHDVKVDPEREVIHAAYIFGPFVGYAVFDVSDPLEPPTDPIGVIDYDDYSDYTAVGEPGWEFCHQAHPDPDRDLVIVGDEVPPPPLGHELPGGKHVIDVGWDEGSLEDPRPIGFTNSPDARPMTDSQPFWWTTHFHDVIHDGDEVLLVDGGYRNGAWVANVTDPRAPEPLERYATTAERDRTPAHGADEVAFPFTPPFAWGAAYNEERDFVFVSDTMTGAYTFSIDAEPARGDDRGGPAGHFDPFEVLADPAPEGVDPEELVPEDQESDEGDQ